MKVRSLFALVTRTAGLTESEERLAERIVRALGPAIVKITAGGDHVTVPGLGVFRGKQRKARQIDLPQGVHVALEPRTVLTFRATRAVRVLRRGE